MGPVLRTSRPRRFPEDGRTVTQKAIDYTKYRNLEIDYKSGTSFAVLDNSHLSEIASNFCVKLGKDNSNVINTIEALKEKELASRDIFKDNNPEIFLPTSLNIEVQVQDFPPLPVNMSPPDKTPLGGNQERTWVQVVSGKKR